MGIQAYPPKKNCEHLKANILLYVNLQEALGENICFLIENSLYLILIQHLNYLGHILFCLCFINKKATKPPFKIVDLAYSLYFI